MERINKFAVLKTHGVESAPMSRSLQDQLATAYPFYRQGRKHPPHNTLSVEDTFKKFKTEFLPLCPLTDKLNRTIKIEKISFRKLINLKHKILGKDARAWMIIQELETGVFNSTNYEWQDDRIRTLFWVPEVITDPDAIYKNNHKVIQAEEVFVCVYDKEGSRIKLAFTSSFDGRIEIVSTYLTDAKTAMKYVQGKPLYIK
jgi:hypothetical protein